MTLDNTCLHRFKWLLFFCSKEATYNPLDSTLIHPESYNLAERLLTSLGLSSKDIGHQKLFQHLAKLSASEKKRLLNAE